MLWQYKIGVSSEKSPPSSAFGFVYEVILKSGHKYIGKKNFWSVNRKPLKKNGERRPNSVLVVVLEKMTKEELDNRTKPQLSSNTLNKRVTYEDVKTEAKWRDYCGSSKEFTCDDVESKRILQIAKTKRALTYLEVKWMFACNVLESDEYINGNILNKFHDNVLE